MRYLITQKRPYKELDEARTLQRATSLAVNHAEDRNTVCQVFDRIADQVIYVYDPKPQPTES